MTTGPHDPSRTARRPRGPMAGRREDLRGARLDALLRRVAGGDAGAFEELYDATAAAVHGLALRVLRDPAQAEEVAQEVLVEVWRTARRYDPARGGAMGWIMTMAHRRAVDRVRSEHAAAARDDRAARLEPPAAHDGVADLVMDRLDRQRLLDCMDHLTGPQRESITLAYYDGHTYREVADRIGVPLGTVKARMRDGMIRLRDCLGVAS
ncbi:ECF RNA polymerase sigma factor SigK [Actinomadura montaniterrae]|uniref:Sigma-70 family RNA polymerase sigma factor n=1 Tax=Actinomadura montaniterrae TaxID=1803903 RepID=A0A6L3VGY6_9ACTN|nr:ECF RNA polymerase sigma factor SigK [Actinomadura montaniterrae]KAB2367171.1 sigma-70 family RNA polymerase sigma factor [Actinomadura montaniterrae]